jgi:hypothetical protein
MRFYYLQTGGDAYLYNTATDCDISIHADVQYCSYNGQLRNHIKLADFPGDILLKAMELAWSIHIVQRTHKQTRMKWT